MVQCLNIGTVYNIPHYVPARISMEAAAERKSPAVLEIYPLESLV